jgi:hypothetical protein
MANKGTPTSYIVDHTAPHDVPVSMGLEPEIHKATMNPDLESKLLFLTTAVVNQADTIAMLTENQRRIDQLRALSLVGATSCLF